MRKTNIPSRNQLEVGEERPVSLPAPSPPSRRLLAVEDALALQRAVGNRATSQLLSLQGRAGSGAPVRASSRPGTLVLQRVGDEDNIPVWQDGAMRTRKLSVLKGGVFVIYRSAPQFRAERPTANPSEDPIDRSELVKIVGDVATGFKHGAREVFAFAGSLKDARDCHAKQTPVASAPLLSSAAKHEAEKLLAFYGGGAPSKSQTAKIEAPPDPMLLLAKATNDWFNCGNASRSLQSELDRAGGKLKQLDRVELKRSPEAGEKLLAILNQSRGRHVLLDCSFYNIHSWTIERTPDDTCFPCRAIKGSTRPSGGRGSRMSPPASQERRRTLRPESFASATGRASRSTRRMSRRCRPRSRTC
jgi:hypothetical protein